ncbi:16S rRNA (guanine(527)-N(7))-methyltransferase RsmG [Synechocystis salina LEGE 06155]|nr:16S rRNA (guanine(527)-N(7))-methyltransferase RsmG [Synechocystis salina LEGE 06155]
MESWPQGLAWQPDGEQIQALVKLYQGVLAGNARLNLTRITAPLDFLEKHLWDSLAGILLSDHCRAYPQARVIDIGTGGGFPGLPVALVWPQWSVALLDSTRKKINYLEELGHRLGLANLTYLVARAEAVGNQPQHRAQYDLALIRAVGEGAVCAEYALPLVKVGGTVVLYRGQWSAAEAAQLERASALLGGKVTATVAVVTPWSGAQRHFIYLTKEKSTPNDFPRAIGIPRQHPLGVVD